MQKNIHLPSLKKPNHFVSQNLIFSFNAKNELLKNKLLHSQNRMIKKPLLPWMQDIRKMIQSLRTKEQKKINVDKMAEIYHHSTEIFLSMDNKKYAREICYSQIQMFIYWSRQTKNADLLKYVFQPWINLSRIDRVEGFYQDAIHKLTILNLYPQTHPAITTYSMFELVKTYLQAKRYVELIEYVECQSSHESKTDLQEALIIALANTGNYHEASALLAKVKLKSQSKAKYIFHLREAEMHIALDKENASFNNIYALYRKSLKQLNAVNINPDEILLGLHTAHVLKLFDRQEEANKLLYFCLKASHQLNDELLTAECLVMLYHSISHHEGKKLIENMMIEHYFQTRYVSARMKMLNCFPDLKYVECMTNDDELTSLFEDLLAFSMQI